MEQPKSFGNPPEIAPTKANQTNESNRSTNQQISHTPKNINSNNGDEDNIFPMSSYTFQHHQDNRSFNPILQKEINKVVESGKEKKEKKKRKKKAKME